MTTPSSAARLGLILLAALGALVPPSLAAQPEEENPYLELTNPRYYTLTANIDVRAFQQVHPGEVPPTIDRWSFQSASVVFPLIERSASHEMAPVDRVDSELRFNDKVVDTEPELIEGYPLGTRLGKWVISEERTRGKDLSLEVQIPMTTYRTDFNDRLASRLDWPKGWPEEARIALEQKGYQWGIELGVNGRPFDLSKADAVINQWTEGNDIRQLKPLVAAKFLTGKLVEHIQPSGDGISTARTGLIEGVDLVGSVPALMEGRGSPFDMTCALALVFRRVGLPSRVVIGYDVVGGKSEQDYLLSEDRGRPELRPWVEFALYDEDRDILTWVPVDPVYIRRKVGNRMRDGWFNRPLRYFGTHDELDRVLPFSFHFHPPTTVRAYGSPGFWGWLVMPAPPDRAFQELRFNATTTPRRSGNRPGRRGR